MSEVRLFHEDQNKKILVLEPWKVNAIILVLYQKQILNGLQKDEVWAKIEEMLQGKVSDLEKEVQVEFVERDKEKDIDIKECPARAWIYDTNMDMKAYLDSGLFDAGIESMLKDKFLRVERLRGSVTQGEAAVYCNGEKVVQYGDPIYLRTKDGRLVNGFNEMQDNLKPGEYGPIIGGWGSIKSDFVFASAATRQYPEEIRTALLKDMKMLDVDKGMSDYESYQVEIPDTDNFFDYGVEGVDTHWFQYFVKNSEGKEISSGIYSVDYPKDTEWTLEGLKEDAIAYLTEHIETVLAKPSLSDVKPILRNLIEASVQSDHGMVFIDLDEDFDKEYYSPEALKELWEEVQKYGLENYVEVTDVQKASAYENFKDGTNIITVYMGIGTEFNLTEKEEVPELSKGLDAKISKAESRIGGPVAKKEPALHDR